ncbi:MAG: translocation/assembly module TamB domain-containing protein, partial [Deltaproteobacteria bacterium]|nr:translocation/assembly module TamB domain-containing protein [Deltaproteobacteria bacterium]
MWRRLIIIFCILAGVLTGAALFIKSERVTTSLRSYIESFAKNTLGFNLQIEAVNIDLWPPCLRFDNAVINLPKQINPIVILEHGSISINPWPTATGAVVISQLTLDGVHTDIDTKALRTLFKKNSKNQMRLPFDIRALNLHKANIKLRHNNWRIKVSDANIEAIPTSRGRRTIQLNWPATTLLNNSQNFTFATKLHAIVNGSLDQLESIQIIDSSFIHDKDILTCAGIINFGQQANIDLNIDAKTTLDWLGQFDIGLPPLRGQSQLTLKLHGPFTTPTANIRLKIKQLVLYQADCGDLEVEMRLLRTHARIDSFKLTHKEAGMLTGSGTIDFTKKLTVSAAIRLHNSSLPLIIEKVGLNDAWVDARVNGDVALRGQLNPLSLQLETDISIANFRVFNQSFHNAATAKTYLQLPMVDAKGIVAVNNIAVSLNNLAITRNSSHAHINGELYFDSSPFLQLQFSSDNFELSDLGPIANINFDGHGALHAMITGPYSNPFIASTIDFKNFSVDNYLIGDTTATIFYNSLVLRIEDASGYRSGGSFTANGSIDFNYEYITTEATADIYSMRFNDLLATINITPRSLNSRISSNVNANIKISGSLLSPTISCELSAPSLSIDTVNLGGLLLSTHYDFASQIAKLHLETHTDHGQIVGDLLLETNHTLTIDTNWSDISLAAIAPLIGDVDISGDTTGKFNLFGSADSFKGNLIINASNLIFYKTYLNTLYIKGKIINDKMIIKGTTNNGLSAFNGEITLTPEIPFWSNINFKNILVSELWKLNTNFDSTIGGDIHTQGLLTDSNTISAKITINQATTQLLGIKLQPTHPLHLHYDNKKLAIIDFAMIGNGITLNLNGYLKNDGSPRITLTTVGELDSARLSLGRLQTNRGHLEININTQGTWETPYFFGSASIKDAAMHVLDSELRFDSINGKANFTGRNINIEGISTQIGQGRASVQGQITLLPERQPELELHGNLDNITLNPQPQLNLTLRGDLHLLGPTNDPQLTGNITMQSLRYNANIDIKRLIPKRNVPPLRVTDTSGNNAIRLGIKLNANNSIFINSPVLDAELRADLMITGTTERLGLIGSMSPLWARARYQENVFTIERASILFTDEYRIFTEFDLRAHTQACNMDVTVDIQGTSDSYNVIPNGIDKNGPVAQQDVLTCLQFGLRLRDLRNTDGELSDRLASRGLDALWAVSGLDQQVQRILPIVDELRVASGWSQRTKRVTPRMVVGKDLGENLQLSYSRALDVADDQMFSVAYQMNELTTVMGTWNTGSDAQLGDFGLDLRLR